MADSWKIYISDDWCHLLSWIFIDPYEPQTDEPPTEDLPTEEPSTEEPSTQKEITILHQEKLSSASTTVEWKGQHSLTHLVVCPGTNSCGMRLAFRFTAWNVKGRSYRTFFIDFLLSKRIQTQSYGTHSGESSSVFSTIQVWQSRYRRIRLSGALLYLADTAY